MVNAADAVSEGSQQVITITYTTKPAAQIIVKFNESQIEVHNNENSAETISDGQAIYEGKSIFFQVKNLAAGQQFDMWKVNTKGLNGNVYTVNAADAVSEGSQQVITIMYTTKPGTDPVIIKFDSTVTRVHYRTADMSITNGQTVYADTELYLSKQKHVSDTVNKWLINTKEYAANKYIVYKVNPRDAIEENGQKVIRISFTVTATQTLTVKFDPDLIECKTVSNRIIESDEDCPPYTYAIFKARASDPQVKYWEINDKKISKSEGLVILEKQIDPAIAVNEGGKKVVKVNLVFE